MAAGECFDLSSDQVVVLSLVWNLLSRTNGYSESPSSPSI